MVRRIDVDAFGIVLRNLIENALIHGSDDRPVTIALSDPGTVTITNAGPVVAAANLDDLTTRCKRGRTEASGSGLGLSIATSLVERMGGTIQFKSPATRQSDGFEAVRTFPSSCPPAKATIASTVSDQDCTGGDQQNPEPVGAGQALAQQNYAQKWRP